MKIQTDGSITPQAVVEQACTKLIGVLHGLEGKFSREFSFKEAEGAGASGTFGTGSGAFADDPYGTGSGGGAWDNNAKDYLDF